MILEQRLGGVECVNHVDIWKKSKSVGGAANAKALWQEHGSQCAWSRVSNGKLVVQRGQGKEGKRLSGF